MNGKRNNSLMSIIAFGIIYCSMMYIVLVNAYTSTSFFTVLNVIKSDHAAALMTSLYFLILVATLMSTYLSPIDTIMPPIREGSTFVLS